jgi:hypothetical protein
MMHLLRNSKRRFLNRGRINASWYWPLLERYRDQEGRTLAQSEYAWLSRPGVFDDEDVQDQFLKSGRWALSPRPGESVGAITQLIGAFFAPEEAFNYLEFGACFGTTFAAVMGQFPNAHGIALEQVPERAAVARWLIQEMDVKWNLAARTEVRTHSVLETDLSRASVDVVFMDTDHGYPGDYDYVMYLLDSGALAPGFLFIGEDPFHTGTDTSRRRLISELSDAYKFITRPDLNLFWFYKRA